MKIHLVTVILFVSLGMNLVLSVKNKDAQRALNRPYIESFLIAPMYRTGPFFGEDEIKDLVKVLLLDFMNNGFFQPLNTHFKELIVLRLRVGCSREKLENVFDIVFQGVNHIDEFNGVFCSGKNYNFAVMGGTDMVTRDYSGDECKGVVKDLKKEFFKYFYEIELPKEADQKS